MPSATSANPEKPEAVTGRVRLSLLLGVVAVAWGGYLRLRGVQGNLLFGDEFSSLPLLSLDYGSIVSTYDRFGSGLALPLLQRLGSDLIGLGHWSLRLPALLGSLGAIAAGWWLAEKDTPGAGGAAALLLALSPFHVFYGHFARIYGLLALGALLLLAVSVRVAAEPSPGTRHFAALAVLGAGLAYLHLTAAGLVASLFGGLLTVLLTTPATRSRVAPLLVAGAGAGVGALLLYGPALHSLIEFVRIKTAQASEGFGLLEILSLVVSSRPVGLALLGLAMVGLLLALRRRDPYSLLLATGVIGPALVLFAVRPYGDAYAYARYLMPSLTFLCLWAVRTATALLPSGWPVPILAPLIPALFFAVSAAGEGWPARVGPHGNTYLDMLSMPAFDAPWPGRSAFYATLRGAGPVTLIEAPALLTRSRHLHRNAFLEHGHPTLLGFLPGEQPTALPAGPYVTLEADALRRSGADLLVLHRNAPAEVARYWEFVYSLESARLPAGRAFMERHQNYFTHTIPDTPPDLVDRLRAALGPTVFEDDDLLVWRLRG